MKLFLYDSKHEKIDHEYDIGELSKDQLTFVKNLVVALKNMGIGNARHKELVLAEGYTVEKVDEDNDDDFPQVEFIKEQDIYSN